MFETQEPFHSPQKQHSIFKQIQYQSPLNNTSRIVEFQSISLFLRSSNKNSYTPNQKRSSDDLFNKVQEISTIIFKDHLFLSKDDICSATHNQIYYQQSMHQHQQQQQQQSEMHEMCNDQNYKQQLFSSPSFIKKKSPVKLRQQELKMPQQNQSIYNLFNMNNKVEPQNLSTQMETESDLSLNQKLSESFYSDESDQLIDPSLLIFEKEQPNNLSFLKCDNQEQENNKDYFYSQILLRPEDKNTALVAFDPNRKIIMKRYKCKFCDKNFEKSCALGGHISRVHKQQSRIQKQIKLQNKLKIKQNLQHIMSQEPKMNAIELDDDDDEVYYQDEEKDID